MPHVIVKFSISGHLYEIDSRVMRYRVRPGWLVRKTRSEMTRGSWHSCHGWPPELPCSTLLVLSLLWEIIEKNKKKR